MQTEIETQKSQKQHKLTRKVATMRLRVLTSVLLLLVMWSSKTSGRTLSDKSMIQRHEEWMALYARVYTDDLEKEIRYKIFKENVEFIEAFNSGGNKPYKLGINAFADLTNEEFKSSRYGYRKSSSLEGFSRSTNFRYGNMTVVPASIDWRKKGAVTPIKAMSQCGSSQVLSAVAATEGINKLSTGKLISLSEQEILDCDEAFNKHSCSGGKQENVFSFIVKNKGIASEASYPDKGASGTCNTTAAASPAAKITGYEKVTTNSEKALLQAVANQPVSVMIDAGEQAFQFYSSGVFSGDCGTDLDYGVAVVGYGTDEDGKKYWIVKNSWGTSWGEKGYIRMERDVKAKEGLCGIAMDASYPTA